MNGLPHNWEEVDAVLVLGDLYDGPPRTESGLVEMQRLFMKWPRGKTRRSSG